MEGLLKPQEVETIPRPRRDQGGLQVEQDRHDAGCIVKDGIAKRNAKVRPVARRQGRLHRQGRQPAREKDDARDVKPASSAA